MLRLIPADTLLRTLPRYLRDLALALDKKVNFEIKGDEVKMDKLVLEGLHDPLTHLLRNALDHGVESAEIRKSAGKPEEATIEVCIKEEGDHICIKITDDGGGIDIKKVEKIALEKNIITPAELEVMTSVDVLNLIFRPGFSTKEKITTVSGRGVGLDVVKANIENLKGSVHVTTELGKGSTFDLQVPITLASERGFLIRSAGQPFFIPTSAVERVLILKSDDIFEVESTQAIMLDNHPVYLLTLSNVLKLSKQTILNEKAIPIVVMKKGWLLAAFVVDEIVGEREIILKTLNPPLSHVSCVAGGTMSSDGEVILVLDALDILNQAFHIVKTDRITFKHEKIKDVIKPQILVVDDSITTRTLEKNVLESNNYEVTVAVDGKEAWDILQKQKFSLLITDAMMPNMDGFELTAHVKQNEMLQDLPVIIVTSLGSDEDKKRGIEAGADYYIVKSDFESGALLEIVGQLI